MAEQLPFLTLAPMQDVTDLAFLRTITPFGGADLYTTPYFRAVPHTTHTDEGLISMITENPTGRPIFAQLIGSDPDALSRMAKKLQELPIEGIDLNIGCPAPIVCRKNAGGGALRDLRKLDLVFGRLREACRGKFSIKTRLGYDQPEEFEDILPLLKKHSPDMLIIHARTVREGYRSPVHPEYVKTAVEEISCPVVANGNIVDIDTAQAWWKLCRPAGLMVGRGAVRNPWLFSQIKASLAGGTPIEPRRCDVLSYIRRLFEETSKTIEHFQETAHIHRMKKFMVYILQGLPPELEYSIRRATTSAGFHSLCSEYLDNNIPVAATPPSGTKLFSHFEELAFHGVKPPFR